MMKKVILTSLSNRNGLISHKDKCFEIILWGTVEKVK